jgi:hypothetical protein
MIKKMKGTAKNNNKYYARKKIPQPQVERLMGRYTPPLFTGTRCSFERKFCDVSVKI